MHSRFHFHFSEIIQMSSVNTEPLQQWELFSILLWRGSWFWLFTHFGAIKSPRLRLGLFIAPKCVKSQNQLPFHTMKRYYIKDTQRSCRLGKKSAAHFEMKGVEVWLNALHISRPKSTNNTRASCKTNNHAMSWQRNTISMQSNASTTLAIIHR